MGGRTSVNQSGGADDVTKRHLARCPIKRSRFCRDNLQMEPMMELIAELITAGE